MRREGGREGRAEEPGDERDRDFKTREGRRKREVPREVMRDLRRGEKRKRRRT